MKKKHVSGTKEWSSHSMNVMRGCSHGCLYCYAKSNAIRFSQKTAENWAEEEPNMNAVNKKIGKKSGTIMFPTTHDLTPSNLEFTLPFLKKVLKPGNQVLVVSKPHLDVITEVCSQCEEYKDQILFRFTIGSMRDSVLGFWEPGAPGAEERFQSLVHAVQHGYKTSVSMEPLLEHVEDEVVKNVICLSELVSDAVWIGKMNKLEERLRRNGVDLTNHHLKVMSKTLLQAQSDERILSLYERLKDIPKIKWKESIKKVVGLEIPTESGLDI